MRGQWLVSRVVGALQTGVKFDKYGSAGPELRLPDGSTQRITASLGGVQLVLKCVGCTDRQHFKVTTCKSVTSAKDLWCLVCMYHEQQWRAAGKRALPESELWFILMLVCWGVDTHFAFQCTAHFWHRPLDARHLQQGYYVQIDGHCHWRGMRGQSREKLLARDMQQNLAAMRGGGVLVRIHSRDLECEQQILAALQAAASGYCIVLTPSYAAECYCWPGMISSYARALWLLQPNCCFDIDRYGNHRFWLS